MKNTLIIDGHNLAFRSYHLIKAKSTDPIETKKDDIIYIFLNSFLSYFKMGVFTDVIFTWDHKSEEHYSTEKNFRKEIVDYKENRDHTSDEIIFVIIEELIDIVSKLGCKNIMPKSLEADDIIFYICKEKPGKKFVVSSDKDLLQIVDENTSIYSPNKKIIYNIENFKHLMNMSTDEYVLYKAILGDTSDNIVGVPKYGTKKSHKLATNWENLKNDLTPEQMEIIDRNLKVVDLAKAKEMVNKDEYDFFDEQFNKAPDFQENEVKKIFKEKNYKKFLYNFHEWEKLHSTKTIIDFLDELV